MRRLIETPSKTCKVCGASFSRRPRSCPQRFAKQECCSTACAAASRKKLEPIACPQCGETYQPIHYKSKFCSRACSAAAHKGPPAVKGKKERYRRVTAPDGTRQLEHRVVMEGVLGRPLLPTETVHHKHGDTFDNRPEHLELWCKPQPSGQRVSDLIDYIAQYHAEAVLAAIQQQREGAPR